MFPLPPQGVVPGSIDLPWEIITPSGRRAYLNPSKGTYSITSASYARRIRRGYEHGVSVSVARGHAVPVSGQFAGMNESQRRRANAVETGDELTPWQRVTFAFERRWGFSYSYWRRLKRLWVDDINSYIKNVYDKITPAWISEELSNRELYQAAGFTSGEPWIEQRLAEKLADIQEWQERKATRQLDAKGRSGPGSDGWMHWHTRDNFRPVEWWYYHY